MTCEASDKSRIASIACVRQVIEHTFGVVGRPIRKVYVVSDGCASQFRSRFVFMLLQTIFPEIELEWHYNQAHHGKGPMDGIGGTVKNKVFREVLSNRIVVNTPEEFTMHVNNLCDVQSLYLPASLIPEEPEDVKDAKPIPETLKIHKVVRGTNKRGVHYAHFYYLSRGSEPIIHSTMAKTAVIQMIYWMTIRALEKKAITAKSNLNS